MIPLVSPPFVRARRFCGWKTRCTAPVCLPGVIATPREVAIGCGLSVRFDLAQTPQVMQVYRRLNPGALIGFYRVEGYGTRHLSLTPLLEKR